MNGSVVVDSKNSLVAGVHIKALDIPKAEKIAMMPSFGNVPRKSLADISNLQQWIKPMGQDERPQTASLFTKEYDQLQKEHVALLKLLAEKNKLVELSGIELQKLRMNLQKVQQQNRELAQANSQMLADLNSGKDRLKALHHELGCKNSLLKAKKLELEEKIKARRYPKVCNEGEKSNCEEGVEEASEADKDDYTKPGISNKRLQTRRKSIRPSFNKPAQVKEKSDIRRPPLRRQSAKFKSEETQDIEEPTKPAQPKEKVDNKSRPLRRQSARFKPEEITDSTEPTEESNKPIQAQENKRPCLRRESGRFKFEETTTQPNEDDQFQINDGKLPDDPLCDDQTDEDSLSSLGLPAQNEATEASNALRCDPRVYRRSSIGRPLRLSVAKVHSYKEPSLLTKLRRAD